MKPDELDCQSLYLFVFGPGKGESIVLRVPPNHWIVIDSCRVAKRAAALHILGRYEGFVPSCIVLTHPHRDHYLGFSQVLDYADWAVIGCCDLRLEDDNVDSSPDPEIHRRNELEQIMSTVQHRWQTNKDSEWWTWRSTHRSFGESQLTALHPTEAFAKQNPNTNPNNLSAAILLEWQGVRLLLGADVENPHWQDICDEFASLNVHAAMKSPHHASTGALHDVILNGTDERLWFATPYSLKYGLPNFADGHGPHRMLQHVPFIHLTGLPVAHSRQMEQPCEATRNQLLEGEDPAVASFALPGGIAGTTLPTRDDLSCYVVATIDASGVGEMVSYGRGSVKVREG